MQKFNIGDKALSGQKEIIICAVKPPTDDEKEYTYLTTEPNKNGYTVLSELELTPIEN